MEPVSTASPPTATYRAVLALPGVGPLTAVALVARIPAT